MSKNAFLICLHFHCASSEGMSRTDRIRTDFGLGLFLLLLILHGVQLLFKNHSKKGSLKVTKMWNVKSQKIVLLINGSMDLNYIPQQKHLLLLLGKDCVTGSFQKDHPITQSYTDISTSCSELNLQRQMGWVGVIMKLKLMYFEADQLLKCIKQQQVFQQD